MSYLYGKRFKAEENDLILALREVNIIYIVGFKSLTMLPGTIH
jgi:hypothetical protein